MTHAPEPDLKALLDTLLPGDGSWPAAGDVITPEALPEAVHDLARQIAGLSRDARIDAVAAFEATHPAAFGTLYHAVADAYYATPEAARVLHARAAATAPDTSGPQFDKSLLEGVLAGQRGKRRL